MMLSDKYLGFTNISLVTEKYKPYINIEFLYSKEELKIYIKNKYYSDEEVIKILKDNIENHIDYKQFIRSKKLNRILWKKKKKS